MFVIEDIYKLVNKPQTQVQWLLVGNQRTCSGCYWVSVVPFPWSVTAILGCVSTQDNMGGSTHTKH